MKPHAAFALSLFTLTSAITIPPNPASEASNVQWISTADGFDGPKVSPINATTWDWWYFDVIQPPQENGDQSSVVAIFYSATAQAFPPLSVINEGDLTSVDLVQVITTWPNGTVNQYIFNGTQATITTAGDGCSAEFAGTGASFTGSADMKSYQVVVNAPEMGIVGSMQLQSRAPAHCPCGAAAAGQNMQLIPHVGWANAVPDADAQADFTVNGERLSFSGAGYHDKNWGDRKFGTDLAFWYWGHARVGDYSVVWFDALTSTGEHQTPAYVAKGNQILVAQCSGLTVRPLGDSTAYPPTLLSGPPEAFQVDVVTLDGLLSFTAGARRVVAGFARMSPYTRWLGPVSGTLEGREGELTGQAMFEQFVYSLS